jgi:hypothetical protein
MGSVRDFLTKAPYLCGAPDPERYAWIAGKVYDEELGNKESVFALNATDKTIPENRFAALFQFPGDAAKRDYCLKLVTLRAITHYIFEHQLTEYENYHATLLGYLDPLESKYPDVAEVMTVKDAAYSPWWTPT